MAQLVPDGLPAPVVVSQLIRRALGPRAIRRPRVLSDWAGLFGPAPATKDLLARHAVSDVSFYAWRRQVLQVGANLELTDALTGELARPSGPGEDHQARRRHAQLLGSPVPVRLSSRRTSSAEQGLARIAGRVLAALGPRPVSDLAAAMSRTRRPSGHIRVVTIDQLTAVLRTADGMTITADGTCRLTRPRRAHPGDLELLDLARRSHRTIHNRPEMVGMLTAIGYARSVEPTLAKHPLLVHVTRGHWIVRTPT